MSQKKPSLGTAVSVASILLAVLMICAACAMPVPGQTAAETEVSVIDVYIGSDTNISD